MFREHLLERIAAEPPELLLGRVRQTVEVSARANHRDGHRHAVEFQPELRQLVVQVQLEGGNAFSFGRLHALEQTRAAEQRRRFDDAWAATADRYPKGWMKA